MNAIVGTVYTLSEEKCVPVEEFNNYLYSLFMFFTVSSGRTTEFADKFVR